MTSSAHDVGPALLVPTVTTDRLVLRGHRIEDFDESIAMWSDPKVVRYVGGKPFTREGVWSMRLRYAGHWALMGYGYWVVEERASGRFVGEVGFAEMKREIVPSIEGCPEAGWVLSPWSHGQGFATEAVRAALTWGAERFGPIDTVCIIDPDNVASLGVAKKCGYEVELETVYKGEPIVVSRRSFASS